MSEWARAQHVVAAIREVYGVASGPIPLHAPIFNGRENEYVSETIASTFVSSVGSFVNRFEQMLCELTGVAHAVATVNGTTALQMSLLLAGVKSGDLVVTQALSFVATANASAHAGASIAFVDVDRTTLGMSPSALRSFLENQCHSSRQGCMHKETGRRVGACVPMHTFGHPCDVTTISEICTEFGVPLIEDAAESLGSSFHGKACGTIASIAALSFNGNKIVTTGGGGAILTSDADLAKRAKHLTTTAKIPHRWRFFHDEVGYNFRMPNLNAALGCAQLEQLAGFVSFKRDLAKRYKERFDEVGFQSIVEPAHSKSNYWLCGILCAGEAERDAVLTLTNNDGVMTRPIWEPMHKLPMYVDAPKGDLNVTDELAARIVNIPSGVLSIKANAH